MAHITVGAVNKTLCGWSGMGPTTSDPKYADCGICKARYPIWDARRKSPALRAAMDSWLTGQVDWDDATGRLVLQLVEEIELLKAR